MDSESGLYAVVVGGVAGMVIGLFVSAMLLRISCGLNKVREPLLADAMGLSFCLGLLGNAPLLLGRYILFATNVKAGTFPAIMVMGSMLPISVYLCLLFLSSTFKVGMKKAFLLYVTQIGLVIAIVVPITLLVLYSMK